MASPILHSPPPPGQHPPKPKGILKNAPPPISTTPAHLKWDEANIAETDLSKETFMKIDEPKTPYVRYNAELDEVEGMSNIPDFSLTQRSPAPSIPPSPHPNNPSSPGPSTTTSPHPRRPSFGNQAAPTASTGSSRSASFSLPGAEGVVPAGSGGEEGEKVWGEVEEGEDLDEEAMRKHEEFVKARGRHYSNEAEAMKMARYLPEEEEEERTEEVDVDDDGVLSPVPVHGTALGTNGVPYGSAS